MAAGGNDHETAIAVDLSFGIHAVGALIERTPERISALWVQKGSAGKRLDEVLAQGRAAGIPVRVRSRDAFSSRLGTVAHQGVIAFLLPPLKQWQERDIQALITSSHRLPLVLVLDGVKDPHNLGACLRSADAAGVTMVIIPQNRAAGMTATVRKVACGAAENIALIEVVNLARCLRKLKELGVWLVGMAAEAEPSLYAVDLTSPVAIILGAEEKGLRLKTRAACDHLVNIPLSGTVSSLNVSVAAGICLFEAVRQRQLAIA